jgi:hypothetical protein
MSVSPLIKNTSSSFHMDITLLSDLPAYNMIHTHLYNDERKKMRKNRWHDRPIHGRS